MAVRRRITEPDQVQADPARLSVYARELLVGEDMLRGRVLELEKQLTQLKRALVAADYQTKIPNPLPSVLACLDDRVELSTHIGRLAGAFEQVGDERIGADDDRGWFHADAGEIDRVMGLRRPPATDHDALVVDRPEGDAYAAQLGETDADLDG